MAYRNIFIENNTKISIKDEQLTIFKEEETKVPLEDINCIIIDNLYTNLSTYVLNKVSEHDIMLYVCNDKHLPTTMILSNNTYCRRLKRLKEQIELPKPLKKRLWQNIVIQKVYNQGKCLELLGISSNRLYELSLSVQSGDITNIESTAAAYYFKALFGNNFTRRNSDFIVNSALNYGYAIVRGMICRTLVTYGFETSIGLFHHNELNNFNLADDLIECFRPLVDLYIVKNLSDDIYELTTDIKKVIFNVVNQIILIDNKKYNIQDAIEHMIMTLSTSVRELDNCLKLPILIPLEEYRYG